VPGKGLSGSPTIALPPGPPAFPPSPSGLDDSGRVRRILLNLENALAGCQEKFKAAEADKQREMIFGNKGFEKAFALKKDKAESSKN
jgi:hypothetical protein